MATKVRFSDTKEMAQAAAEQMVLGTDLNTFRSNLMSSYAPVVGAGFKSHLGALQGVQSQVTEAKKTIQSDISSAYSTYLQNQMALARNQNLMAGYKANISDAYANAMALSKGTVADAYKAAEAAGAAGVAEQMSAWEGLKQEYNKSIEKTYGEAADVVAKEQKWATQAFDATIQALYDALGGNTQYFTDIGDDENELYTLSQEGEKLLFDQSDAAKGEFKLSELGKQLLAKQFGDTSTGMDKYFKASNLDDYNAEKSLAFKNALLGETWETDYEDIIADGSKTVENIVTEHNYKTRLSEINVPQDVDFKPLDGEDILKTAEQRAYNKKNEILKEIKNKYKGTSSEKYTKDIYLKEMVDVSYGNFDASGNPSKGTDYNKHLKAFGENVADNIKLDTQNAILQYISLLKDNKSLVGGSITAGGVTIFFNDDSSYTVLTDYTKYVK